MFLLPNGKPRFSILAGRMGPIPIGGHDGDSRLCVMILFGTAPLDLSILNPALLQAKGSWADQNGHTYVPPVQDENDDDDDDRQWSIMFTEKLETLEWQSFIGRWLLPTPFFDP